ncbi:hypothetical protein M8J76_013767 [Diaphorina citri]|nr:hypothetical protein M8J76_013767 [Diaphorina citri]
MYIHVKHSEKLKVELMASGIGYSIRTEPCIISQYDFGCVYIDSPTSFPLKVINYGSSVFDLLWSTRPDSSGALYRISGCPWDIKPNRFPLGPGEECVVRVSAVGSAPGVVKSEMYLLGFVNGDKINLHTIEKSQWRVQLLKSILVISPEQLIFRVDHLSANVRCVDAEHTVDLYNPTRDTLYTRITVRYPFYLSGSGDWSSGDLICAHSSENTCEVISHPTPSSSYSTSSTVSSNFTSSESVHLDCHMKVAKVVNLDGLSEGSQCTLKAAKDDHVPGEEIGPGGYVDHVPARDMADVLGDSDHTLEDAAKHGDLEDPPKNGHFTEVPLYQALHRGSKSVGSTTSFQPLDLISVNTESCSR